MLGWLIMMVAIVAGLMRLMRLHTAQVNDAGSPKAEKAFEIVHPTNAQAIYGRFEMDKEQDFYTFEAEKDTDLRAILLIPKAAFNNGLRASFRLYGPGLPEQGARPKDSESPMHIAGKDYVLVQSYVPALPVAGRYQVVVRREQGAGTYCFCVGKENEGLHPGAEVRARVTALLAKDE